MVTGRRRLAVVTSGLAPLLLTGCVVLDRTTPPAPDGAPPATAPPAAADGATPAEAAMARAVLERVDAERAARGLPALTHDEDLADVARSWNAAMAERDRLEHQDMRALLRRESLGDLEGVGENVFRATGPVAAGTVHAGWMRSDGHRANVLQPGWDRVGIAVLCADDGSVWATQQFGRSAGADLPPLAEEVPPAEPLVRPEDDGPRCG